jgi:hypothetical protein
VLPNVGAKGDSSGVTPGPEDRKCTPYLGSGPGGTPLLLPLERLVRRHAVARHRRRRESGDLGTPQTKTEARFWYLVFGLDPEP